MHDLGIDGSIVLLLKSDCNNLDQKVHLLVTEVQIKSL